MKNKNELSKKYNYGNKDIETIENNYDNMGILKIVKYLLKVIISDIEYMNTIDKDYGKYDLGNNYVIDADDFESIVSMIDTIEDIEKTNNEIESEEKNE